MKAAWHPHMWTHCNNRVGQNPLLWGIQWFQNALSDRACCVEPPEDKIFAHILSTFTGSDGSGREVARFKGTVSIWEGNFFSTTHDLVLRCRPQIPAELQKRSKIKVLPPKSRFCAPLHCSFSWLMHANPCSPLLTLFGGFRRAALVAAIRLESSNKPGP